MSKKIKIAFVCTENSNRSQMAEAFAKLHFAGRADVYSAGSRPSGVINPKAIGAMAAIGIDITFQKSEGLEQLPDEIDLLVTMGCGDSCPTVKAKSRQEWDIPDPREMDETEFIKVRDMIKEKVGKIDVSWL